MNVALILLCERSKLFACVIKLFQCRFGSNRHILVPRVGSGVDVISGRARIQDSTSRVVFDWLRLFNLWSDSQVLIRVALSLLVFKKRQCRGLADATLCLF